MSRCLAILVAIAACGGSMKSNPDPDGNQPDAPDPAPLIVQPAAYSVPIGRSQIFVAEGATRWSVVEGAAGGTVDASGNYSAPLTPGTYHLRASNDAHSGLATIAVADFRLSLLAGKLGGPGYVDDVGVIARLGHPNDIVGDGAGKLYFSDGAGAIRVLDAATGAVSTLAGTPGITGATDGIGSAAAIGYPDGLAIDPAHGVLYVTQSSDAVVRKIVIATREVTTLAGKSGVHGSTDGVGSAARFETPAGISFDGVNTLWLVDKGNCLVRTIAVDSGTVATVAGTAGVCTGVDGTTAATFDMPQRILYVPSAMGGFQRVFIADLYAVRMITAFGVSTIAGSATTAGNVDQPGAAARFGQLAGITTDGSGTLYVTDHLNCAIRTVQIATPNTVATFAGGTIGSADGLGGGAQFYYPGGLAMIGSTVWLADTGNDTIRTIDATRTSATIAGNAPHPGHGVGSFGDSRFDSPTGLTLDGDTVLYLAESDDVRALSLGPQQSAVLAGNAKGAKDGTGTAAMFHHPNATALDATNHVLYVADNENSAIRAVTVPGAVVATPFNDITNTAGGLLDGTGTNSKFYQPAGVVQVGGTLYVADTDNHRIRAIDIASKTTTTFAGSTAGFADGTGTAAQFESPYALATDGTNLYVSDSRAIRAVELASGTVTTIAGRGAGDEVSDGIGLAASFSGEISGMAYDGVDSLYITDIGTQLVRRMYLPTAAVGTFAGIAYRGGVRLDSVTAAQLGAPSGIAILPSGTLLLASYNEHSILQLVRQ